MGNRAVVEVDAIESFEATIRAQQEHSEDAAVYYSAPAEAQTLRWFSFSEKGGTPYLQLEFTGEGLFFRGAEANDRPGSCRSVPMELAIPATSYGVMLSYTTRSSKCLFTLALDNLDESQETKSRHTVWQCAMPAGDHNKLIIPFQGFRATSPFHEVDPMEKVPLSCVKSFGIVHCASEELSEENFEVVLSRIEIIGEHLRGSYCFCCAR
mmetsp:Transcript_45997/g.106976  ORF Transcript_45997/g.106976 Transcript_45997/m.106976 type:complete len:210 (-) Transcript_45997:58-687(-)